MKARKQYNVPYPNLYATPGYHKDADAFNRVQRGHQNGFEYVTTLSLTSLIGGLKHPYLATLGTLLFNVGSYFYLIGYADTKLDVKTARYMKGGGARARLARRVCFHCPM